MSENRQCFTYTWKIKNFSFIVDKENIVSPPFVVEPMGDGKWVLKLHIKSNIACYLNRDISGTNENVLDYELSLINLDGLVLISSEKYINKSYVRGTLGDGCINLPRDEVDFLPEDTLTIRCRMWDKQNPLSESGRCFAETQIITQSRNYVGIIDKFSSTKTNGKYLVCIKSPPPETFFSSLQLVVSTDDKLLIELKPLDNAGIKKYRCEIFIRDAFGNKVICGKGDFFDAKLQCINLTLSKEHLINNKMIYLRTDVLTLIFKVIFSDGEEIQKIDEPEYGFCCEDVEKLLSDDSKSNLYSEEQHIENYPVLKDDLISLYRDSIFCDTKLKTATETFPVHALILSARSSVFKSMFATDMKERTSMCVDIDDLDADTVRRMILFMYSDSLDDLEFESAKTLYYAADKYNIALLKSRCSNFLKHNLLISNCCDVLLLSDKHQDADLKRAVQDYIAENDKVVLISEEWKILEKNHSQLALEVFRFIYLEIKGK